MVAEREVRCLRATMAGGRLASGVGEGREEREPVELGVEGRWRVREVRISLWVAHCGAVGRADMGAWGMMGPPPEMRREEEGGGVGRWVLWTGQGGRGLSVSEEEVGVTSVAVKAKGEGRTQLGVGCVGAGEGAPACQEEGCGVGEALSRGSEAVRLRERSCDRAVCRDSGVTTRPLEERGEVEVECRDMCPVEGVLRPLEPPPLGRSSVRRKEVKSRTWLSRPDVEPDDPPAQFQISKFM